MKSQEVLAVSLAGPVNPKLDAFRDCKGVVWWWLRCALFDQDLPTNTIGAKNYLLLHWRLFQSPQDRELKSTT